MGIEVAEHQRLISATAADLPEPVAAALAHPSSGRHGVIEAAGIRWATVSWGTESDPPVVLVHGVTSESMNWWRTGPAVAALGRHVIAVDLPGHGATGQWAGRHRHIETATDLAEMLRRTGLDLDTLDVVAHSWGAMVASNLPKAGLRPRTLVLIDPPYLTRDQLEALTRDPIERRYETFEEAIAVIRSTQPRYHDGDVRAKAIALTRFDVEGVRSILVDNGDWHAGLDALADPSAAGIAVWYIRGAWDDGGLIPDSKVPEIAARVGADHVLTIAGGPHSPMRTHPEATTLAILRALDSA